MRPLHATAAAGGAGALDHLQQVAPRSPSWFVNLPDARQPALQVLWREAAAGRRGFANAWLDPATGETLTARETRAASSSTASISSCTT